MRDIEDTYKNGQYVRRWSWVNGEARCVENAVAADVADMDALLASNQFVRDTQDYTAAVKRLSQYVLADGRAEAYEDQPTGELDDDGNETTESVLVQTAIDQLPATVEQTNYDDEGNATTETVPNPLITQDNLERTDAQAVVDATPQAVIDAA
jgi:hypothetical protein